MSRFFKSVFFPILIVVVLALFAQSLISPQNQPEPPTYSEFLQEVDGGQVASVTINTKDNTIEVDPKASSEETYDTAYPPTTPSRTWSTRSRHTASRSTWRAVVAAPGATSSSG